MRLCVGDRVQVRDSDSEPWEKGTVKQLVDGRPKVQRDDMDEAFSRKQVQPLVITQLKCYFFFSLSLSLSLLNLSNYISLCLNFHISKTYSLSLSLPRLISCQYLPSL